MNFKVGDKLLYSRKKRSAIYYVMEVGKDYFLAGREGSSIHMCGKYHLDGSGFYAPKGPDNPPLVRHYTPLEQIL